MSETPTTISHVIEYSRDLFKHGQVNWARPMVNALEQLKPMLALKWALNVFDVQLLGDLSNDTAEQYKLWIHELGHFVEYFPDAGKCNEMAYRIWDNDFVINLSERAIARLYWALILYHEGNMQKEYCSQVNDAVVLFVDAIGRRATVCDFIISRFQELASSATEQGCN